VLLALRFPIDGKFVEHAIQGHSIALVKASIGTFVDLVQRISCIGFKHETSDLSTSAATINFLQKISPNLTAQIRAGQVGAKRACVEFAVHIWSPCPRHIYVMQKTTNEKSSFSIRAGEAFYETLYQFFASFAVTFVSVFFITSGFTGEKELKQFIGAVAALLSTNHWWTIASVILIVGFVSVIQGHLHDAHVSSRWWMRFLSHVTKEVPRMVVQLGATFSTFCVVAAIAYLKQGDWTRAMGAGLILLVAFVLCVLAGGISIYLFRPTELKQ
jgi:hypothetical protein